jgi:hypothetical protein
MQKRQGKPEQAKAIFRIRALASGKQRELSCDWEAVYHPAA